MSGQQPTSRNVLDKSIDGVISLKSIYNARKTELAALEKVTTSQGGRKRAFQLLPRHLRRRAMSHNPYLVPRRLRDLAIEQSKDTIDPKDKKKFSKARRSIQKRKESSKNKWLETHMWHAKRFKMQAMWGYKLPYESTMRAKRCIYRECKDSALIYDSSYTQSISITGERLTIISILQTTVKGMISNLNQIHVGLIRDNENRLVAPIYFHGRHIKDSELAEAWIWVSAPGFMHVSEWLDELQTNYQFTKRVQKDWFSRFEIMGPKSSTIVSNVLKPLNEEQDRELCKLLSIRPGCSGSQDLFILQVKDPRLAKNRHTNESTPYNQLSLSEKISLLPLRSSVSLFDAESCLWNPEWINSSQSNCSFKDHEINKGLIPLENLSSNSTSVIVHKINGSDHFGAGWCLIVPHSWSSTFWKQLSTSGVRVIGFREKMDLLFEQSKPRYPMDYPGSQAYAIYQSETEEELLSHWERRPPAKRVNYHKLGIESPFKIQWDLLFPEISERDLVVLDDLDASKDQPNTLISIWLSMESKGTVISKFCRVYDESHNLLGFVTSGQFSQSHGKSRALAFCKSNDIYNLMEPNHQKTKEYAITLLVKNINSQYYHKAIATPTRIYHQ